MSFDHIHRRTWDKAAATPLPYEKTITVTREANISESIPDSSTDLAVYIAIDVSALTSLFIASDQDITIETNNPGGASGSPDDTLTLKADQPIDWCENDVMTCPITADVTVMYVTNASGSTATLEIRSGMDATP